MVVKVLGSPLNALSVFLRIENMTFDFLGLHFLLRMWLSYMEKPSA